MLSWLSSATPAILLPSLLRCVIREGGSRGHHFLSHAGVAGLWGRKSSGCGRCMDGIGGGWQGQMKPQTDEGSPTSSLTPVPPHAPQCPSDRCYRMDSSRSLARTPSPQVSGSWFPHLSPGGAHFLLRQGNLRKHAAAWWANPDMAGGLTGVAVSSQKWAIGRVN